MTELIFIRHAEAEGNALRVFHGHYNSCLTEKGHKQADMTGKFLSETKIDKIYTSDLTRTYMTALHIAAYQGCEIEKNPGLREMFAGDWENRPFEELKSLYPEIYEVWHDNTFSVRLPNGESGDELIERMGKTVDSIAKRHDGQRIAIVSHATAIRSLRGYYEKLSHDQLRNHDWPTNASVSKGVYIDGSFKFDVYSYDCFLENI